MNDTIENIRSNINQSMNENMVQAFYTINPHIKNLSQKRLYNDFRYCLQKYYRQSLGRRYYKDSNKDKQYQMAIFPEQNKNSLDETEPHLHIIIVLPKTDIEAFFTKITQMMLYKYPSLSVDIQPADNSTALWQYCTKEEDQAIYTKTDLFEQVV
jgi:hypothetical protein